MSVRIKMASIRKANEHMMAGKTIYDFDLPDIIKSKVSKRKYSASEINLAYSKIKNPALGKV